MKYIYVTPGAGFFTWKKKKLDREFQQQQAGPMPFDTYVSFFFFWDFRIPEKNLKNDNFPSGSGGNTSLFRHEKKLI